MCCNQASWAQAPTFTASRQGLNPSGRIPSAQMVESGLPLHLVVQLEKAHSTYSGSIQYFTSPFYVSVLGCVLSDPRTYFLVVLLCIVVSGFWVFRKNYHTKFLDLRDLFKINCVKELFELRSLVLTMTLTFSFLFNACWKSCVWLKLLAMIGEQFDEGDEICGAVVSVRARQDKISIWTKTASNEAAQVRVDSICVLVCP